MLNEIRNNIFVMMIEINIYVKNVLLESYFDVGPT